MTVWEERLEPIMAQLDALTDELACFDYLVDCAGQAPWEFDEDLRKESNLVRGCDSRMWLEIGISKENSLLIRADSDSMLLRGLLMLVKKLYEGTQIPVSSQAGICLLDHPRLRDCFSAKQLKTIREICKRLESAL